ncbi:MAG TPA: hypothetical protein PLQ35_16625 [bacterium]|nr:hypothetical protein [bacterium]
MMEQRWISFFTIVIFCATVPGFLYASNFAPHDWEGSDLTLQNGDVIWGLHKNVGTLKIPKEAVVGVLEYATTVPGSGYLDIQARAIILDGKIDAKGKGFPGGGGGGGGGGAVVAREDYVRGQGGIGGRGKTDVQIGMDGGQGKHGEDEPGGTGGSGGQGLGNFGGIGGAGGLGKGDKAGGDGAKGNDGGYDSPGANTDTSTDTSIRMGCGGGGGGGGAGGGTEKFDWYDWETPQWMGAGGGGGGGASGGTGGGYVRLIVSSLLLFRGEIDTSGTLGLTGANGTNGSVSGNNSYGGNGGNGANVGPEGEGKGGTGGESAEDARRGGTGGDSGAGSGGGVVLACDDRTGMILLGTIHATGGGDLLTNGGTVKILYPTGEIVNTAEINAGRVFEGSIWPEPTVTPTPTYTPTPSPTLSPTDTPTPIGTPTPAPIRADLNRDGRVDFKDLLLFQQDWWRFKEGK